MWIDYLESASDMTRRSNETQMHLINWTETQTETSPASHNMKLLFLKLIFKGYAVFSLFCIQDTSTLLQHCLFAGLWWGVCLLLTCKSYMPCQYNADSSVTDDQPYLFSSCLHVKRSKVTAQTNPCKGVPKELFQDPGFAFLEGCPSKNILWSSNAWSQIMPKVTGMITPFLMIILLG